MKQNDEHHLIAICAKSYHAINFLFNFLTLKFQSQFVSMPNYFKKQFQVDPHYAINSNVWECRYICRHTTDRCHIEGY